MDITFELFFGAACIIFNAFFVAAEFSLVKVRGSRLQELANGGNRRASLVLKMQEDLEGYLSATQLGITVCSIGLGSVVEPVIATAVRMRLEMPMLNPLLLHTISIVIAVGVISFFQIVVGEIVPRSLAIRRAEKYILRLATFFYLFRVTFKPLLIIFERSAKRILRLLGVREGVKATERLSEDELRLVLTESAQKGSLTDTKLDLIDNVFDFSKRTAKQIMISRDDIVSLDLTAPVEDNLAKAKHNNHTRYPLCEGSIDQIIGLVNFKDVLWQSEESRETLDLRKIRREILFIPENKPLTKLLKDFQRNKIHMAIIIDEYGVTSGLVTLEDVLEELVGEIQDEYDQEKSSIQLLRDGTYMIEGSTLIEDVEEKLGITIEKNENTTIAGAVLYQLGRLPRVGDVATFENFNFNVRGLKGRRVNLLQASKKSAGR